MYNADYARELETKIAQLQSAIQRVRELHRPERDSPLSLITWEYCSCGTMETFTAPDGHSSIGPARYPCPTIRALDEQLVDQRGN